MVVFPASSCWSVHYGHRPPEPCIQAAAARRQCVKGEKKCNTFRVQSQFLLRRALLASCRHHMCNVEAKTTRWTNRSAPLLSAHSWLSMSRKTSRDAAMSWLAPVTTSRKQAWRKWAPYWCCVDRECGSETDRQLEQHLQSAVRDRGSLGWKGGKSKCFLSSINHILHVSPQMGGIRAAQL